MKKFLPIKLIMLPALISFTAVLLISCSSDDKEVLPPTVGITADIEKLDFDAVRNVEISVVIDGVGEWSAEVSSEAREWLHANKEGSTLKVSADDHYSEFKGREGTITISTTVAGVKPLEIPVTQSSYADPFDYGALKFYSAYYFGNDRFTNTGRYRLTFIDDNWPQAQLVLCGFGALADNPDNYIVTPGTYTLGENGQSGAELTYEGGDMKATGGTLLMYEDNDSKQYIAITGGTYSVEYNGEEYIIKTDFSGIDIDTSEEVRDIRFRYRGSLTLRNQGAALYEDECSIVRIKYYDDDFISRTVGQYLIYMYVGKKDSGGSLLPPYKMLTIEAYAENTGRLPAGTYACRLAFWSEFNFIPYYPGAEISTHYREFSAANPDSPYLTVNITSGTFTVSREENSDLYTIETEMGGQNLNTKERAVVRLTYTGRLEYGNPL